MGTNYGQFNGNWLDYKPSWISDCGLWLDGSDSAYLSIQSARILNWYDKSNLTYTLTYTTDFSAGTNGWWAGGVGVTITGAETANGESDWLKCDDGTDTSLHHAVRLNQFLDLTLVRISGTYFVPNESNLDGLYAGNGNNVQGYGISDFEKGKTKTFSVIAPSNDNNDLSVGVTSGTGNYTGDNNLFYIKNITRERLEGSHTYQVTFNSRPSIAVSTGQVAFDGSDDFLEFDDYAIDYDTDTQGELITVFKTHTADTHAYFLGFESGSEYHYFGIRDSTTRRLTVWNYKDSGTDIQVRGSTALANDTFYISSISSNGSVYRMFLNGVEESSYEELSGTNNGDWTNDIGTLDTMQIGRFTATSTAYEPLKLFENIYYHRQLTDKERRAVFNYLNTKYGIY